MSIGLQWKNHDTMAYGLGCVFMGFVCCFQQWKKKEQISYNSVSPCAPNLCTHIFTGSLRKNHLKSVIMVLCLLCVLRHVEQYMINTWIQKSEKDSGPKRLFWWNIHFVLSIPLNSTLFYLFVGKIAPPNKMQSKWLRLGTTGMPDLYNIFE